MRWSIPMLAVVLVLGSASVAAAECAWVLWSRSVSEDASGHVNPYVINTILFAYPTYQDCQKERERMFNEEVVITQSDKNKTGLQIHRPNFAFRYVEKGATHTTFIICLPDTIDPREKKD